MKLAISPFEGCVLIAGVFQLNHGQGQAIDEHHHVGAAVVLVLDNGVLIDRQPVVVIRIGKVDQPGNIPADAAVLACNLNRDAFHKIAVQAAVLLDEGWGFRLLDLAQNLIDGFGRQMRVDARSEEHTSELQSH